MPTYDFVCQTCGAEGRAWRQDGPPRFCSRACMAEGMSGISRRPVKYEVTSAIRDQIEKVYKHGTGDGQVADLAKRLGWPRWKISRFAQSQGWVATQAKEPDWRPEELDILERNAHHIPGLIQKRLKARGYSRTLTAIVLKRKRMRFIQNIEGQSARGLAECLGVDVHFVTRAINEGRLKASKRGTERTPQQGGDIYLIKDKWARDYIVNHVHEIDIRKADKYWLVDLLANRAA